MLKRQFQWLAVATCISLLTVFAISADESGYGPFLEGRFLVASPEMKDPRFAETVIVMIDHDNSGAFGLIVNRELGTGPLKEFLHGFGVDTADSGLDGVSVNLGYGGPVDRGSVYVLHGPDYAGSDSHRIGQGLVLSRSIDILRALANGRGPKRFLIILGYSGWGAGQLESEIALEDWVSAPLDADVIFVGDPASVWSRVLKGAGLAL